MADRGLRSKIWALLTPGQRRGAFVLLALMLVGAVLETLSIGVVIPALSLLTQSDFAARHPAIAAVLGVAPGDPARVLVLRGMLALVIVYAVKNVFIAYSVWRQNGYAFQLQLSISQELFARYLRRPYTFHLQKNSAELVRNVGGEVDIFASSVMSSAIIVMSEALVMAAVIALIMAVEPVGAVIVATVTGSAAYLFWRLSRPHVARWGERRQLHAGQRVQHLQQGLGGVKDVKLLGREADFIEQFRLHSDAYAQVGARQNTLLQLPRLWLELLVVGGLAALVATMLAGGRSLEGVLPTLGLFAAAAFRLLPSLNRILTALQALRYGLPVVNVLHAELTDGEEATPQATTPLPFTRAVTFDNVSFRYESADAVTLPRVSLGIAHGSTVGFIGQSGAGKTTLVDILLGLLKPDSGRVLVDGIDIQTNLRGWQDQVGYVPQSIFLTDDTLRRNVAFGIPGELIDTGAVERAIRAAQLDDFVSELPAGLDTVVGERGVRLSGGQRQRIGIARALYHDPAVLVLDEATSSLDPETEHEVMESVGALHGSKTIVIVSHRMSTMEYCDRVFRLERGRVVEEGEPAAVVRAASR